jgi:hypothetical protein
MTAMPLGPATAPPTTPGYVAVLLLHIAATVIGFGSILSSGVQASRLAAVPAGSLPTGSLLRYFTPGGNWAGRVIYAVPVLGLALVGLSDHAISVTDGWVLAGLGLWVLAAGVAEGVTWPAERRVRGALAGTFEVDFRAASGPGVAVPDPPALAAAAAVARPAARRVSASAAVVTAIFVAATVLMVAQP